MDPLPYLTKSVEEKLNLEKVLPKNGPDTPKKPKPKENCLERSLMYLTDKRGPAIKFLKFILKRRFFNYVFVSDSDTDLRLIERYD